GGEPPHAEPDERFEIYAAEEATLLAGAEGERLLAFWRQQLQGEIPVLRLPADTQRPALMTYAGDTLSETLSPQRIAQIGALSLRFGVNRSAVALTAFLLVLRSYTREDDLCVGMPVGGRADARFADAIGYF